jgi:hypothetical protein
MGRRGKRGKRERRGKKEEIMNHKGTETQRKKKTFPSPLLPLFLLPSSLFLLPSSFFLLPSSYYLFFWLIK